MFSEIIYKLIRHKVIANCWRLFSYIWLFKIIFLCVLLLKYIVAHLVFSFAVEVIETDPDFKDIALRSSMFNGGGEISAAVQPPVQPQLAREARKWV